jgi:hypothetical protein
MAEPSDEAVGQALLEASRYGDLEDLRELVGTYGARHLQYRGGGGNTSLHYGERVGAFMLSRIALGPWPHRIVVPSTWAVVWLTLPTNERPSPPVCPLLQLARMATSTACSGSSSRERVGR